MKTISISALFVLLGVAAFGQINFPDGSTATTGELTDVTIVQAGGTAAANGTALRAAMDAISGANASAKVIQLAAGTYNLGGNTLTMKPFTHLRGVGKQATIITGSGDAGTGVMIEGAAETFISELTVSSSASGVIMIRMRVFDGLILLTDVFMESAQTGGGSGTALQLRNGAEADLFNSIFGGDSNNSGGSRVAVDVSGSGSACFSVGSLFDMIELSGTGSLVALLTASGGEIELHGGELLVERDVGGSAVTGISVGSGTQVTMMNTTVIARVNGADSVAVSNGGGFKAFSTFFQGTIPNPAGQFFNSNTDSLLYSQCSQGFTDI